MLSRVLLAALTLVLWQSDAFAVVHNVTQCNETCSTGEQCNLQHDIACSSSPGVTLNGGADFDFKGSKITCSGCAAVGSRGVLISNSSSTVEDSVGGGGVYGAWEVGVDGQNQTGSWVKNVLVDGSTAAGIYQCKKVQNDVVIGAGNAGIYLTSMGATDYIRDNYVRGNTYGIFVSGSAAGEVDHNVVVNASTTGIFAAVNHASMEVTNNILYGTNTPIQLQYTNISTGNVCGDTTGTACATCVSSGWCEDATAPFVGP